MTTPLQRPQLNRRKPPARDSKTIALLLSMTSTVWLAWWFERTDAATAQSVLPPITSPATTTSFLPSTLPVDPGQTSTSVSDPVTSTTVTTVTYTGPVVTNKWGPVQVQVTLQGSSIVDVQVRQYPTADRKSVRINQSAVPKLIEETLTAQSAAVNTVSGATYTSNGYRESLQAALDSAKQ